MASIPTLKSLSSIDKFIINGAVTALNAPDHIRTDKDKMVRLNWLGDLIEQGLTDFNFIKNCSPVADNVSTVDSAKLDATASVAVRAEAVALDAINKVAVAVPLPRRLNPLRKLSKMPRQRLSWLTLPRQKSLIANLRSMYSVLTFATPRVTLSWLTFGMHLTAPMLTPTLCGKRASSNTCSSHKRLQKICGSEALKALGKVRQPVSLRVALDALTPVSTFTSTPLPMTMRVL